MKRLMLALLALVASAAPLFAADWQYWSTWSATHDVSDKAQVSALTEAYFRGSLADDYVYDEYVSYFRKLGHGFGLLGQLYFESVKTSGDTWAGTRSAVAGLSYEKNVFNVCKMKIEDRLFYRLNSPAQWDYHRPRLYLTRDIGKVKLSLSDEMRIDMTGERAENFYRNRIYAMVSTKVTSSLLVGLGYLCQSDKIAGDWISFNGVQSLVSVQF